MKPLRLCDLPDIPLIKILCTLHAFDVVNLTACSSKMESTFKRLRLFMSNYTVCILNGSTPFIQHVPDKPEKCDDSEGEDNSEESKLPVCNWFVRNGITTEKEPLSGLRIISMMEPELSSNAQNMLEPNNESSTANSTPIRLYGAYLLGYIVWLINMLASFFIRRDTSREGSNLIHVAEWLMKTLPSFSFGWNLDLESIKPGGLEFILDHPLFKSSDNLKISGGSIDSELMRRLIDECSSFSILIIHSGIPEDFRHENPIKAELVEIRDACWVTIDNVLRVRGNQMIRLGTTNFGLRDVRAVIREWLETDGDTFLYLRFLMREDVLFHMDDAFEGVVVLKTEQWPPTYFITRRSSKSVLSVKIFHPDVVFCAEDDSLTKREKRILKELYRKADLEQEIRTLAIATEYVKKQLKLCSPETDEHQTLMEKMKSHSLTKDQIIRKRNELVRKLEADDIDFSHGLPVTKTLPISER